MNKKKVILILILGALVIVSLIAILVSAKPKENGSLDALTQTTEQESQTEDVDINTETEPSSEPETVTESESEDIVSDESETREFTEPEPDSEELAKIDEIDKKNKEIFAKNKELPTVVAYSGVDTSELIMYDDYEVGGLWFFDNNTYEQYFIYADCNLKDALACIIREPIVSVENTFNTDNGLISEYTIQTEGYTYTLSYNNEEETVFGIDREDDYTYDIFTREEADKYIEHFLSDDTASASGCGCGCGTDDSVSSCTAGSECGGNSSDCGV